MKQFVNTNPIALHFYSPEELLPDDNGCKIIIYKSAFGELACDFACFSGKRWYSLVGIMDDIIAWATFSPDWLVSESDRDIFGCK